MEKQRFYVASGLNDDNAYTEAMQFACNLANEDPEIKRIVLLVATKRNIGWFERLFDSKTVKQLFKGIKFKGCKPVFKIETKITYHDNYTPSDVVITCALDSKDVLKIDDYVSVKAIIAIPWLETGIDKWVKTWSPKDIRGKKQVESSYPEPSCIVKKAMQSLTKSINPSTGINHPSDEARAKTFILALHKYEPSLNEDIIGAYLVRELNWDTSDAKDVEILINKLNSGKHFQGGERKGLQNYYKRWKSECNDK